MPRPINVPSHIRFTNSSVARLPLAAEGQYLVRDVDLKNFFVVVGRTEKTFTWERTDRAEELRSALFPKTSRSRTNGKPTKKKSAAKKRTKSIRPRAAAR